MSDCFTTIQDIVLLINGSHDTKSGQHIGIFEFEGKKYTLKDLVMIEMDLQKKGTSKTDPAYQKFNKMLKELINLFKVKATPLIQKTKSPVNRAMNEKLVNYWLIHSGRKNSIITSFGADKEFEAMEKCSAKEFFLFLNDLKCFLKDLMHSAPKACTLYKKECLKPENYAAFDAFLNH